MDGVEELDDDDDEKEAKKQRKKEAKKARKEAKKEAKAARQRAARARQRAAKAAKTAANAPNGKPGGKPAKEPSAPAGAPSRKTGRPSDAASKLPPPGLVKAAQAKAGQSSLADQSARSQARGLLIFSHFGLPKPVSAAKGDIHPAIARLALQFSAFKITGANARCIATLTAFKTVRILRK